ncbi:MAG: 4-alpha-glucanotransferase [Gammaproteobacteria bacterium]
MNSTIFSRRRAGLLLHPTSLPGTPGNGDLGADAYRFIDLLSDCGFTLWQMLPLGPTHEDFSPYQCQSVHAGSFRLINLQMLVEAGWLDDASINDGHTVDEQRREKLKNAFAGFNENASDTEQATYQEFRHKHAFWLEDFALYQSIREDQKDLPWVQWPTLLRDRDTDALLVERQKLNHTFNQNCFEQFLFFKQWHQLRDYANQRGVLLFGDIPIFVAHDSADVWANRDYFSVDDEGMQEVVAGVPPDYFSETGQRWGNPLYRWDKLQEDGYHWWIERIRTQLELFDLIRIDHFRGFEACWEINASEETAMNGHWQKGPGEKIFLALQAAFDHLPLVAEDLGLITPEVTQLREQFGLPGMKILQFAFDGASENPYLPHNHETMSVVYTGTHDNDTTLGWYQALDDAQREIVSRYFGHAADEMPWLLIRTALASVARMAILPMQDLLGLDSDHRMNIPGVAEGNWQWRFEWSQLDDNNLNRMRDWLELYGRKI